jgi:hypothetical protein
VQTPTSISHKRPFSEEMYKNVAKTSEAFDDVSSIFEKSISSGTAPAPSSREHTSY